VSATLDNRMNGAAAQSVHAEILPDWLHDEMGATAALIQGADDERLDPSMFVNDACQIVADAVYAMKAEGVLHPPEAVVQWLRVSGSLDDIGGPRTVYNIASAPCHPEAIRYHTDGIIRAHERRLAQRQAERLLHDLNDITLPVDEALSRFETEIRSEGQQSRITMLPSSEFFTADFRVKWAIDWLLVEGQPCILAGPKKSLKTNALIDFGVSAAMAGEFLNFHKFKVNRPYRVGILSGESGGGTIQETARRVCKSKGIEKPEDIERLFWSMDLPTFGDPASERDILRIIERNKLEFIIFDPAYLCLDLGDDAGNLFKVGQRLRSLTRLHQLTGVTPMIAHHFRGRRDKPGEPPELEEIAWAGFQEWARQWLLVCRREPYDPERQGDHRLWLSAGGSAGHSSLWGVDIAEGKPSDPGGRRWDVQVMTAGAAWAASAAAEEGTKTDKREVKAAAQLETDTTKLLKVIAANPDGETERFFRDRAGLSGTRAGRAFQWLEEAGEIERCTIRKNNRGYEGYKSSGSDRDRVGLERDSPAA